MKTSDTTRGAKFVATYYILKYTDKHPGCPTSVAAELNEIVTEWPIFVPDPWAITVTKEYVSKITDAEINSINFDMDDGDQKLVSRQFINVCRSLDVPHRAIPVTVLLATGLKAAKDYFFFLPGANLSLLDRSRSEFKDEVDLESGCTQYNGIFPDVPVYAEINRFEAKENATPHLFFCTEIFELVCTEAFRASGQHLLGVECLPLDESYRYAPWDSPLELDPQE